MVRHGFSFPHAKKLGSSVGGINFGSELPYLWINSSQPEPLAEIVKLPPDLGMKARTSEIWLDYGMVN